MHCIIWNTHFKKWDSIWNKWRFYDFNFLVCYRGSQYCLTGFKISCTTLPRRGRAEFTSKYWLSKRRTWSTALKIFRQSKSTIPFSRLLEDPLCRKLIMCSAVKPSAPIWLFRKSLTVGCFRESCRNISWQLCHNDCLSMPCLARKVSISRTLSAHGQGQRVC